MKYEICPIQPPKLEMSSEQYGTYLENYSKYIDAVRGRKAAVKEVLVERDKKRIRPKKKAEADTKVPGPVKRAKNKTKKAKRKLRKLLAATEIRKATLDKISIEQKILSAKTKLEFDRFVKKPVEGAPTPKEIKGKSTPKGKTLPKTGENVRLGRKQRRAHLHRERTVSELKGRVVLERGPVPVSVGMETPVAKALFQPPPAPAAAPPAGPPWSDVYVPTASVQTVAVNAAIAAVERREAAKPTPGEEVQRVMQLHAAEPIDSKKVQHNRGCGYDGQTYGWLKRQKQVFIRRSPEGDRVIMYQCSSCRIRLG